MSDKTPAKASRKSLVPRKVDSPMTPRQAEKRDSMEGNPRCRSALDYDHEATLFNKKPKIVEKDLKETCIASITVGEVQEVKLVLDILCYMEYPLAAKLLACDNSGVLVVSAYGKAKDSLLHVAKQADSCFELTMFDAVRPTYLYPTASYNGLEAEIYTSTSVRTLGPAANFKPPYYFTEIDQVYALPSSTIVDVVGIIVKTWDNNNEEIRPALEISIFDKTRKTICVCLWHDVLSNHSNLIGKVIAVQRAITSEFDGKPSIQSLWYTQVELDPDHNQAYLLSTWYQEQLKEAKTSNFKREGKHNEEDGIASSG